MMSKTKVHVQEEFQGELLLEFISSDDELASGLLAAEIGDVGLFEPEHAEAAPPYRIGRVSLGRRESMDAHAVRKAAQKAARWAAGREVSHAGIHVPRLEALGIPRSSEAALEGFLLGTFEFSRLKSEGGGSRLRAITLLTDGPEPDLEARAGQIEAILTGANMAREWAHEPPNVINPLTLAERAREMAEGAGLRWEIMDERALADLGAEAILAVGMGSGTPPRLITLEWPGDGQDPTVAPIVLLGKTITFDTGGYSLKSRDGMLGMKYDKWGGMAVAGVMRAVAELGLRSRVVGLIAAAENALSERAYRPNDILRTLSGKTVEVISTDAEGRLVLADALTYAQRTYRPRLMIDLATLTSGVVVALGPYRAGLMSNDDELSEALLAAGERTHERLWRLPLDDDYFKLIKGYDSDLRNSGGKGAQPVTAGMFLYQFVEGDTPWAHIDVAGVATVKEYKIHLPQRATGFGVRLLADYLLGLE
jgi:leucyl aminopeptidase